MVSVGAPGGGMHARVDLPHDPDDVDDVVEALLRPARRNGVRDVVVVVYDDETTVADEAAWSVHEEFTAAGIGVREVLRVHDDHWYAVLPGRRWPPTAASRSPAPTTRSPRRPSSRGGSPTPAGRRCGRPSRRTPRRSRAALPHLVDATPLPPGGLTALVRRPRPRRHHLRRVRAGVRRGRASARGSGATRHGRGSGGPTRGRPSSSGPTRCAAFRPTHVAGPAAVLAFAAWLAGDGALSWCAVDRCRESEPAHSLAGLRRAAARVGDPARHVGDAAARGRGERGPGCVRPALWTVSGRGARD